MMKRSLRPLLAAMGFAMTLSAQAATTLTVASFPSFDEAVKIAIPEFKKKFPDVEIKLVSLAYNDHHTAMTTALATGTNLPDVMGVEIGFIGKFAESGGLEDLGAAPYNAMQYKDKFARFTYPQAMSGTGKLAALPADIGPGALFYRKDVLDKAGVSETDLTKSWESFIESGKKVKAATGSYVLASATALKDIYIRSGLKDGEGIYFDKSGRVLVDSPRFVKAFELAKSAREAGIDAKIAAWSNEWGEGFKSGQIVTEMMGAWLGGHLASWLAPDTKGNWRSAQLPNGAYASWGGSFYAIPKKAPNKQLAWEFVKFMCLGKDQQLRAFQDPKLEAFPALIAAQNDEFLHKPIEFLGGQKARELWKVAADKIPAIAVNKYDATATDVVNAELTNVLEKGKDIKTALADAKKQIERRVHR